MNTAERDQRGSEGFLCLFPAADLQKPKDSNIQK